ncbi:hypothetical protein GH5_03717 [Leishmania sp. Ghana 2012 LV757]|uniref:hypothetical protein n=1 Tax=Leishmania sp. Ghana 2012 LV757 TaxID=2803181 RepID=UPI001B6346C4|nr:hypothetical protein GH5_03717 [Leishmania sp. Ghana 2012 LV757]
MARFSSPSACCRTHRTTYRRAASPAALPPTAPILSPSAEEANSAVAGYSRSGNGRINDTATPNAVNAVSSLVAAVEAKKTDSATGSSRDSNHSHPRDNVQRNRAPTTSRRPSCGTAAHKKLRSTRSTTTAGAAAPATSSEENNLHNSNLFICNLDTKVNQLELETAFAECGTILSSAVMRDIHTGESLGTAFVRMSSHEEARRTMEAMNGAHIGSRCISVQWARRHEGAPVGEARKKIMKLFVRNVPLDCTRVDLEEVFGAYGGVRQVTLHKDTSPVQDEAMVRLIAFVIYTEEGAAERAAREVHNTKPFTSCNGIPIMVKLAEDLAKHYREHSHHLQPQGELTTSASAAKPRPRHSDSQRNKLAPITNRSPSRKQSISNSNGSICPNTHTIISTPSIRAAQSSGSIVSMTDLCASSEAMFCRDCCQFTPPQCNGLQVNAPLLTIVAASLPQRHTMSCVRDAPAPTASLLSTPNRLQSLLATPAAFGASIPAAVTSAYGGATAAAFVNSPRFSLMDFSSSQVQQSFFLNRAAPQLSRLAPSEKQRHQRSKLTQFSQPFSTAPVTTKLHHLSAADTVPESQDRRPAVAIPAPRFATLPVDRRFINDSTAIRPSDQEEESDSRIIDTAPSTHPTSLRLGQSFAATSLKTLHTYRHNPYINCSFMRVA